MGSAVVYTSEIGNPAANVGRQSHVGSSYESRVRFWFSWGALVCVVVGILQFEFVMLVAQLDMWGVQPNFGSNQCSPCCTLWG